jgi:anti-sigma regulatory factor (Ser/Thr protein kinase)
MIFEVSDVSQVSQVRRRVIDIAAQKGFDEEKSGRLALIVTEMASNLLKHATQGWVVADVFADSSGAGIEVMSLDKGIGIANVPAVMVDGFSTAGTMGGGFGAMDRQANDFGIFSKPTKGTAMFARVNDVAMKSGDKSGLLGNVVVPYPGETACGDAWAFEDTPEGPTLLVADGSGHGPLAAEAAQTAVNTFRKNSGESCERLATLIHHALKPTRGAAIAVARIDRNANLLRFVGIGNIAGALVSDGKMNRVVSHGGTAGQIAPRIREFTYPFTGVPTVILHSDGLTNRWDIADYPGLGVSHPSLIAGVLYRDHVRGRDDASIVAFKG